MSAKPGASKMRTSSTIAKGDEMFTYDDFLAALAEGAISDAAIQKCVEIANEKTTQLKEENTALREELERLKDNVM